MKRVTDALRDLVKCIRQQSPASQRSSTIWFDDEKDAVGLARSGDHELDLRELAQRVGEAFPNRRIGVKITRSMNSPPFSDCV
jgi:uncharacterized protein YifE (UPF0438 family)